MYTLSLEIINKCNLNCTYCYLGEKKNTYMSLETAQKVIDIAVHEANKQHDRTLMVYFIGGEPLMAFNLIKDAVDYTKKKCQETNLICKFSTTINGTLVTDEIIDFFVENTFEVKVSLDGPEYVQNLNRRDYAGNGSFEKIMKNLPLLRKYEQETGNQISVASVVTSNNYQYYAESFQFLLDLGIKKLESGIDYYCSWSDEQIQGLREQMPDTHNARRKYKDGKGSFEQIISALELLNNKSADIHTVIRINVDKNNLDEVSLLLEYLGSNGKGLTNCNVDFGIVRGSTQACSAYSGNCLSESIVGEVLSKLWSKAEMEGFTLYTKPFHRWIYCGLYADSQFTVTPNGELYKCWEHAGDEQHLMGNINENGNIDNIKYSFYDWMSHNPLENEECKECVYLPACGGGCGVVSYNETNSYHSKGCFKVKGVLEKQVLRYFKGKI